MQHSKTLQLHNRYSLTDAAILSCDLGVLAYFYISACPSPTQSQNASNKFRTISLGENAV